MDFFKLAEKRQSVREYLDKPVDREIIDKIIEGARIAPSACNAQPWKFVIVDNKEIKEKVAKGIYDPLIGINKFAFEAPVFIVIVAEKRNLTSGIGEKIKRVDYTSIDIGIACEHICLGATELDLGTCIIGWFKEKLVKEALAIPKDREVKLIISLGYPSNDIVRNKVRKSIDEITSYNSY